MTTRPLRAGGHSGTVPDPVRVYLREVGRVALLDAAQEVDLAKRIEAGVFATERLRCAAESDEALDPRLRRDLGLIAADGAGPGTTSWRPTCGWWCRWPSATRGAAWASST